MALIMLIGVLWLYSSLIPKLNNYLLFEPKKIKLDDSVDILGTFSKKNKQYTISNGFIDSTDNTKIAYILIRNNKSPKLFIYAHGTNCNSYEKISIQQSQVNLLTKYGSVLLFDYRSYGLSSGSPSEQGLKDDILSIWKYALGLKYNPTNIILYGESLGASCSAWLLTYLISNKLAMPKALVLQSGFYSMDRVIDELFHPILKYCSIFDFNNGQYIGTIRKTYRDYPIILIHSKSDQLISLDHSSDLAEKFSCELNIIDGIHNSPIFNPETSNLISKL